MCLRDSSLTLRMTSPHFQFQPSSSSITEPCFVIPTRSEESQNRDDRDISHAFDMTGCANLAIHLFVCLVQEIVIRVLLHMQFAHSLIKNFLQVLNILFLTR